jgi:MFS transporter, NNP family, nitrate/nitrite transporter
VCIVPATVAFCTGIFIYLYSDDSPKGQYHELKQHGVFPDVTVWSSLKSGTLNSNTWMLAIQYACCFGVELTMNNAAAMYFRDEFGQSTQVASAVTAIFGWLNLFARGLGGFISDACNYRWGMRGRLWANTIIQACEGAMVFVFSSTKTLGGSIVSLIVFSFFVQLAKGTNFAIIPYVDPPNMGTVMGHAGAGGNVGAVVFGLAFRGLSYDRAFFIMGTSIFASCICSFFTFIPGYAGLICGKDRMVDRETGEIIYPDRDSDAEDERKDGRNDIEKARGKRSDSRTKNDTLSTNQSGHSR